MLSLLLAAALATPVDATVLLTTGASVCAGVVIAEDRVATAYHCIAGGGRPLVETADGTRVVGRVLFARPRDDLAVIEVSLGKEAVPLAEESPDPGAVVDLVGHPMAAVAPGGYLQGLLRFSVSRGVISARGPTALQTTAPVNPGNSGGPVFDEQGELVGIVSRRLRGDGLGFATRVERLRALLEEERRPSPLGGTLGMQLTAGAWSGPQGTGTLGGEAWMSFRDRVVLAGGLSFPVSPRWTSLQSQNGIAWIGAEARAGLRQRFFRGRYTSHVEAYAGVASLATLSGDRDTFRLTREETVHPMVGGAVAFGSATLDAGWVFTEDGVAVRGQLRFAWPGRVWIF